MENEKLPTAEIRWAAISVSGQGPRGAVFATLKGFGRWLRENPDVARKIGYVRKNERNPELEQQTLDEERGVVITLEVMFFRERGTHIEKFYHIDQLLAYLKEVRNVDEKLRYEGGAGINIHKL